MPVISHLAEPETVEAKIALALLRVHQALQAAKGTAAREQSLSPLGLQILIDVGRSGGAATASWLAARYGVSAATVSDALRLLVERRWVARKAHPDDARSATLALTSGGRKSVLRLRAFEMEIEDAAAAVPEPQRGAFLEGLVHVMRRLEAGGHVATDRMCVTCAFFRHEVHAGARPHHCALLDVPLGRADLRVDCPDHVPENGSETAPPSRRTSRRS